MLAYSSTSYRSIVKDFGLLDYQSSFKAMKSFTAARTVSTADEIWLLEHPPVFTLGNSALPEHVFNTKNIPVVQSDRGGQVTYHGPGQLIAYLLFDLNRSKRPVRCFVHAIESAIIDCLESFSVQGKRIEGAPGVYVDKKKIASIGLKISKGLSYHGLSLNVDMDLTPFSYVNPCGIPGMSVTQMSDVVPVKVGPGVLMARVKPLLSAALTRLK